MVASRRGGSGPDSEEDVSIPFIAGQWSLPPLPRRGEGDPFCFNPLHCGAVVASVGDDADRRGGGDVSIPFIAGQWSLQLRRWPATGTAKPVFQSPSLRGSGRFCVRWSSTPAGCVVSIPFIAGQWSLHCGVGAGRRRHGVSIPFIAGQWSLQRAEESPSGSGTGVSIPFIAGQWSLQLSEALQRRCTRMFQSPSLRGSGRFPQMDRAGWTPPPCFNPLHCGAVVASSCRSSR